MSGVTTNTTRRIRRVATLPAACSPGEVVMKTSGGSEGLYVCLTANSWVLLDVNEGDGTVTSVSVASANGLAGSVANPTTTPAITLSTSVTGVLKGNGTAISAASAGTDYVAPGGALGTPASGTLTNATGLPVGTGVSGLGAGVATFLATPSSANLATALTDELGSSSVLFGSEGTWTPVLNFGGATTGITYSIQIGRYLRIGNRVHVKARIVLSSKGSATGTATITGLLVAASNAAEFFQLGFVDVQGATYTGTSGGSIAPTATTTITLLVNNGGTGAVLNDTHFTNTSIISIDMWYSTN